MAIVGKQGIILISVLLTTFVIAQGCKRKVAQTPPQSVPAESVRDSGVVSNTPTIFAQGHWCGLRNLATRTNAAAVLAIWELPESQRLLNQTLDKLALAFYRTTGFTHYGLTVSTHAGARLLRPLLADLIEHETRFQLIQLADGILELDLAIELERARAGIWNTNLAAAISREDGFFKSLAVTESNGWVNVKLSTGTDSKGWHDFSGLGVGFGEALLHIELKKDALRNVLSPIPEFNNNTPDVSLTILASPGGTLRTAAEFNFSRPVVSYPNPWLIPTNFTHETLTSFFAVRAVSSLLKERFAGNADLTPSQLFAWSRLGAPFELFGAGVFPNASNAAALLGEKAAKQINPWAKTNMLGKVEWSANVNGYLWQGFPFMSPFISYKTHGDTNFVVAGLVPDLSTNRSAPTALFDQVTRDTNLVLYSWEVTAPRIESWVYLSQVARILIRKPQLPPKSAGIEWLKAAGPKLANCTTSVIRSGNNKLELSRSSTVGFSALELHLIMDWLESPDFPSGLHTFRAELPPETRNAQGTNSSAPVRHSQ